MEAALGDDEIPGEGRWRLLLLEDCDELIGADAKRASGQALSRLLNLTDGLLGQGRRAPRRGTDLVRATAGSSRAVSLVLLTLAGIPGEQGIQQGERFED